MSNEANPAASLVPSPNASSVSLFHRIWPPAAITFGAIVTVAWACLLGYWLLKLLALD